MILGIIPARFQSTRLPGKPLAMIGDQTMIQMVYKQCLKASLLDKVIVATDDERIADSIYEISGEAVITSKDHATGTDRCIEVALNHPAHFYVNIQGDEPFIPEEDINSVSKALMEGAEISTLKKEIEDLQEINNPSCVKVVCDQNHDAMYFSRSAIPFSKGGTPTYYKHKGIYGFRKEALKTIANLKPSSLELAESLEQLRWLENGLKIKVLESAHESISVDTEEDLQLARKLIDGKN